MTRKQFKKIPINKLININIVIIHCEMFYSYPYIS